MTEPALHFCRICGEYEYLLLSSLDNTVDLLYCDTIMMVDSFGNDTEAWAVQHDSASGGFQRWVNSQPPLPISRQGGGPSSSYGMLLMSPADGTAEDAPADVVLAEVP